MRRFRLLFPVPVNFCLHACIALLAVTFLGAKKNERRMAAEFVAGSGGNFAASELLKTENFFRERRAGRKMQVMGTKGSFGWYLNRLFNGIGRWRFCHVCPVKTLLFNLRSFDLKTALKFPVYIYNNTEIFWLGKVVIDAERIERGMVRIGHWATRGRNPTKICRRGMTVFHGNVTIQGGTILE